MLNINTKSIISHYENRAKFKDEFYKDKKHLTGLDGITKYIDNQSYGDVWSDEMDELFSFLYDNGGQVDFFNDEDTINIKYKDKYYSLCEMQGQGCYRSFNILEDEPDSYINFKDIVNYHDFKKLPYNINVLQLIYRGFSAIKAVNGENCIELNYEKFNLDDVFKELAKVLCDKRLNCIKKEGENKDE